MNSYTIYRIESWDDDTWAAVIDAVEKTTASFDPYCPTCGALGCCLS